MKELDWRYWLIRISQGDSEAFGIVYEATRDHTYKLICFLLCSTEEAGDVMSEVYLELARCAHKYNAEQPFAAWFNGLIVRQVRNWRRKGWRFFRIKEKLQHLGGAATDNRAETSFATVGHRLELLPLLNALPHKAREVLVLRYYHDCTLDEIAATLDIPLGTVKSRHHHALKQMRRRFMERDSEQEDTNYVY